jgi:hypothetical protein
MINLEQDNKIIQVLEAAARWAIVPMFIVVGTFDLAVSVTEILKHRRKFYALVPGHPDAEILNRFNVADLMYGPTLITTRDNITGYAIRRDVAILTSFSVPTLEGIQIAGRVHTPHTVLSFNRYTN